MSKEWFPVIDYDKCTNCLSCVEFCPHGVFTTEDGKPVVTNPDECVDFCRGCQKGPCDYDAISFPPDHEKSTK